MAFIKYLDLNVMSSMTMGIRVTLGYHMCLCRCVRRLEPHLNLWRSKHGHSVFAQSPEAHVVPRVTLIPMVLADIMLSSRYMMKSELDLTKINYPNMGYSNTMGFRVTTGDHMYLWAAGKGQKTIV